MTSYRREIKQLNKKLEEQDKQIKSIFQAEADFEKSGNLFALIEFWESIWKHGGLKFNGSKWTFRLPDIYIKEKRYDDAIRILKKIKNPYYQDKVKGYVNKVNALKSKMK